MATSQRSRSRAVLDRVLFVGSASGVVHALSVESGCLHWTFQANGPVRSAILAVPLGRRHTSSVQRSSGLVLCARRGNRQAALAEEGRRARSHAPDRRRGCPRRSRVRAGGVMGGDPCNRSSLSVLHVPRGSVSALRVRTDRSSGRDTRSPKIPADRSQSHRNTAMGTFRRRRLGVTDSRREARPALCHDRRQLFHASHEHERCRHGHRGEDRPRGVDQAGD